MLGSKTLTYAIMCVYEVARQSGDLGVTAKDLSNRLNIPRAYIAKVLSDLATDGILRSSRGPRGGFLLALPPDKTSLLKIWCCVQRSDKASKETDIAPSPSKLWVDSIIRQIETSVETRLNEITVRTMLETTH